LIDDCWIYCFVTVSISSGVISIEYALYNKDFELTKLLKILKSLKFWKNPMISVDSEN
jgi:hypothetical protein